PRFRSALFTAALPLSVFMWSRILLGIAFPVFLSAWKLLVNLFHSNLYLPQLPGSLICRWMLASRLPGFSTSTWNLYFPTFALRTPIEGKLRALLPQQSPQAACAAPRLR